MCILTTIACSVGRFHSTNECSCLMVIMKKIVWKIRKICVGENSTSEMKKKNTHTRIQTENNLYINLQQQQIECITMGKKLCTITNAKPIENERMTVDNRPNTSNNNYVKCHNAVATIFECVSVCDFGFGAFDSLFFCAVWTQYYLVLMFFSLLGFFPLCCNRTAICGVNHQYVHPMVTEISKRNDCHQFKVNIFDL